MLQELSFDSIYPPGTLKSPLKLSGSGTTPADSVRRLEGLYRQAVEDYKRDYELAEDKRNQQVSTWSFKPLIYGMAGCLAGWYINKVDRYKLFNISCLAAEYFVKLEDRPSQLLLRNYHHYAELAHRICDKVINGFCLKFGYPYEAWMGASEGILQGFWDNRQHTVRLKNKPVEELKELLKEKEDGRLEEMMQQIFDRCSALLLQWKERPLKIDEVREIKQLVFIFRETYKDKILCIGNSNVLLIKDRPDEGERFLVDYLDDNT